jgi:hypothetical protein
MKDTRPWFSSSRIWAVAAFIVVFASGVAVGFMLPHQPVRGVRTLVVRPGIEQFDQLGLDSLQRRRVGAILTETTPRTDSLMRALLPRLRAYVDSVDQVIRRELTPAQQARLDSLRIGNRL